MANSNKKKSPAKKQGQKGESKAAKKKRFLSGLIAGLLSVFMVVSLVIWAFQLMRPSRAPIDPNNIPIRQEVDKNPTVHVPAEFVEDETAAMNEIFGQGVIGNNPNIHYETPVTVTVLELVNVEGADYYPVQVIAGDEGSEVEYGPYYVAVHGGNIFLMGEDGKLTPYLVEK